MIVVIDKRNKRAVNKIAKDLALKIEWLAPNKDSTFEKFDIEDYDDSSFYSLKLFKKRLIAHCEKNHISVNFGVMDQVLEARAENFMKKYKGTFKRLKESV